MSEVHLFMFHGDEFQRVMFHDMSFMSFMSHFMSEGYLKT